MAGVKINICLSGKYAGPVSYAAAKQICGANLYKMGSEYIAIEDNMTFEVDSVVINTGKQSDSIIFDMISAISMRTVAREKTKTYKVKKLKDKDAQGHDFTIYRIV
ncbi:MAG: hypothetical protein K6F92_04990 [Lachnospiraceae bacterium]|nr:hypothetical protein [Lachnospiraceae bacterium]